LISLYFPHVKASQNNQNFFNLLIDLTTNEASLRYFTEK